MSDELKVEIGTSDEEMGHRFVAAWRAAEAGETVEPSRVLVFESLETLLGLLSAPRLDLLKRLASGPQTSIRALAIDAGRDYRRVHADVVALAAAGLVLREGRRIALGARSVAARIDFGAAGI